MENMEIPVTIGILAGGSSRRMGKNKAFLTIDGKSMIERLICEFSGFGEILISAAEPGLYEYTRCRVVCDENPGRGPLEGIRRLLTESADNYVFVCAADMPFLKKELLCYMSGFISSDYDAYVIRDGRWAEPLCAIYSRLCLPAAEEALKEGGGRVSRVFDMVPVRYISLKYTVFDRKLLYNVNTPEDYRRALSPKLFCVSGYSGSGKTTLIEKLIREFQRHSLKAAVIKHDGHDCFRDAPGSDTWRFAEAGACATAVFSDSRFAICRREAADTEKLISMLSEGLPGAAQPSDGSEAYRGPGVEEGERTPTAFSGAGGVPYRQGSRFTPPDVIIIEGMKDAFYPRIEVIRRGGVEKSVCDPSTLMCIATDCQFSEDEVPYCPVYPLDDIQSIFRRVREVLWQDGGGGSFRPERDRKYTAVSD